MPGRALWGERTIDILGGVDAVGVGELPAEVAVGSVLEPLRGAYIRACSVEKVVGSTELSEITENIEVGFEVIESSARRRGRVARGTLFFSDGAERVIVALRRALSQGPHTLTVTSARIARAVGPATCNKSTQLCASVQFALLFFQPPTPPHPPHHPADRAVTRYWADERVLLGSGALVRPVRTQRVAVAGHLAPFVGPDTPDRLGAGIAVVEAGAHVTWVHKRVSGRVSE